METKFKDLNLISEREVYDFITRAVRRTSGAEAVYVPCSQLPTFMMSRFLELDMGLPFITAPAVDFWYPFKKSRAQGYQTRVRHSFGPSDHLCRIGGEGRC